MNKKKLSRLLEPNLKLYFVCMIVFAAATATVSLALGLVEIACTVISENPEQGYLNVFLSHLYLLSGSAEELREFRKIIEEAYTTQAIATATEADITAIREALEQFRKT